MRPTKTFTYRLAFLRIFWIDVSVFRQEHITELC